MSNYCWEMKEVVGLAITNYDFSLANNSFELAKELCNMGTHRFALCSGFVLRLVPFDYELEEYERFVIYDYVEKIWKDYRKATDISKIPNLSLGIS
jgi:hypothetical protein